MRAEQSRNTFLFAGNLLTLKFLVDTLAKVI